MALSPQLDILKRVIQDCHLNFLLGAGLSTPYLKTLGNIEHMLTAIDELAVAKDVRTLMQCVVYKHYFNGVMAKNPDIIREDASCLPTLEAYRAFIRLINTLLIRRKNTLLGKEVNLFTTNIDVFLEKAIEDIGVECNDGFNGRFSPIFSPSHFRKSRSKRSPHFDNVSELPVINLLKLHGSLTWETRNNRIAFAHSLDGVNRIAELPVPDGVFPTIDNDASIDNLHAWAAAQPPHEAVSTFAAAYEQLLIVNPTKEKFHHTLLNATYYDLMRLFSNELEKHNAVLFVMGFSFADEHLREIVIRAANANPTLLVYVVGYSQEATDAIKGHFAGVQLTNNNLQYLTPPATKDEPSFYTLSAVTQELFGKIVADGQGAPDATPASDEKVAVAGS
jgi:hypothetical protein